VSDDSQRALLAQARRERSGGDTQPITFVREAPGKYRSACGHFAITRNARTGVHGGSPPPTWRVEADGYHAIWVNGGLLRDSLSLAEAVERINRAIGNYISDGFGYLAQWSKAERDADERRALLRRKAESVVELVLKYGTDGLLTDEGAEAIAGVYATMFASTVGS
jgi:hypothetical protein